MWTVRATCQVAERNEPVSVQVNPDQTVGDAICEILEGMGLWASRLKGRFALGLVFRPTTGQSGTDVRLDKDKMLRDVVQEDALLEVTGDPGIIHDIESLPDQDLRICKRTLWDVENGDITLDQPLRKAADGFNVIRNQKLRLDKEGKTRWFKKLLNAKDKGEKYTDEERERIWNVILRPYMELKDRPMFVKFAGIGVGTPTNAPSIITEVTPGCCVFDALKVDKGKPAKHLDDATKQFTCLIGVAVGMRELHDKGFVHGDLCQWNVIVNETGEPHLRDWGMLRYSQKDPLKWAEKRKSVGYRAPEMKSDPMCETREADVYAFGSLMYNILSRSAVPAQSELKFNASFLAEAKSLIESCRKANPSDRPSFKDICESLRCMALSGGADESKLNGYLSSIGEPALPSKVEPALPSKVEAVESSGSPASAEKKSESAAEDEEELGDPLAKAIEYMRSGNDARFERLLSRLVSQDKDACATLGRNLLTQLPESEQNMTMIAECFRKSASVNSVAGYEGLAKCYEEGLGVACDPLAQKLCIDKSRELRSSSSQ